MAELTAPIMVVISMCLMELGFDPPIYSRANDLTQGLKKNKKWTENLVHPLKMKEL